MTNSEAIINSEAVTNSEVITNLDVVSDGSVNFSASVTGNNPYTRDNYAVQMLKMLPPGKAFTRSVNSNLYMLMFSLAGQIKQVDDCGYDLAIDWQPGNTVNFLQEWQNSLGLPDKCLSNSSTFEDQRNQVVSRLTFSGASTAKFIQSYADSLGYVVDVKEWGQIICSVQSCASIGLSSASSCGPEDRSVESCVTINIKNNKDAAFLICEIKQFIPPYLMFYIFQNGTLVWSNEDEA